MTWDGRPPKGDDRIFPISLADFMELKDRVERLEKDLKVSRECIEKARAYGRCVRSGWVRHGELNAAIAEYDKALGGAE